MEKPKQCFKCLVTKPAREFYRHPGMADGRLGKCKTCTKIDVQESYRKNIDKRVAYERARISDPARKETVAAAQRRGRRRNPEKFRARNAVSNALRDGRLTRQPCRCGATKVQAHHHDYGKPLDVEWVCFRCHRQDEHGQQCISETTEGKDETMGDENQIKPGPTTTTTVAAQMRKPEPNARADEAMKKYRATMESGAPPAVAGNGTTIIPTRPMDFERGIPAAGRAHHAVLRVCAPAAALAVRGYSRGGRRKPAQIFWSPR